MSFIDNFIKDFIKNNNIIHFDILNNSNYKFHSNFINTILLGHQESKNIVLTPNTLSNKLIKGNSFNHIPISIRKQILNNSCYILQYSFIIDKRVFNIFFHIFNNDNPSNAIILQLYNILFFFNYYSHKKPCNQILNIYIYLIDQPKLLPAKFKILDRENINTAFTYSCSINNEIYIFRKEEWFKSIIHESIHSFGFDFSQNYSKNNDIYSSKILQKYFNVNFDLHLYESYVDMFAIYINSLFYSFYKTYNKDSSEFIDKVLKKVNIILKHELYFSIFQSVKILNFYDINYNDLISNSNKSYRYDENTPIFSYFFIKTILFYNFNGFFEWCSKNNSNIIDFECNNKTKDKNKLTCNKKIKSFCNFIIQNYNKNDLIQTFNFFQKKLINIQNNNFIFNTLRFTIYG